MRENPSRADRDHNLPASHDSQDEGNNLPAERFRLKPSAENAGAASTAKAQCGGAATPQSEGGYEFSRRAISTTDAPDLLNL